MFAKARPIADVSQFSSALVLFAMPAPSTSNANPVPSGRSVSEFFQMEAFTVHRVLPISPTDSTRSVRIAPSG